MRFLSGMIFGALLTVAAVYIADSMAGDGASSTEPRRMVNWDVAGDRFHALVVAAREEWAKLAR
jgi:hypothetical protein